MNSLSSSADPLDTLRPGHPRLLITPERIGELKGRVQHEPLLKELLACFRKDAEALASAPALEHILDGPGGWRLLSTSREALRRILALGILHHIEPDPARTALAKEILFTVAAFPDWNPAHFLDTGEMATTVAIGYDWFFETFTEPERAQLRQAMVRHALLPAQEGGWWVSANNNWNPV